jgi:N6-adenosine-specific RNA methylase IME4
VGTVNWSLQGRSVDGAYPIIYADPPWKYNDKLGAGGYPLMSLHELTAMPVGALAHTDAVLFMWATWPTLPDALALGAAWGFGFKNCGFLWVKLNKVSPTPFLGLGHWTRGNTEPCLLFTRGKLRRVDAGVEQLVMAPLTQHSAKPPEVRDRIIRLMGDQPAVELFARERAPGWDCFGNEVPPETSVQRAPEVTT